MKYQKSMMKLLEVILIHRARGISIELCIREAHTGRNSSFKALGWLKECGFITTEELGNQRIIHPVLDDYTLQFKYYLDSILFKTRDSFLKLIVHLFVLELVGYPEIKSAVLFGSAMNKSKYLDIDLLLLGNGLEKPSLALLNEKREKIERIFGVVLNLHFGDVVLDNLFKGVVVYQSSYFLREEEVHKQYKEFLHWIFEAIKHQREKIDFNRAKYNAIVNLSYVYCIINSLNPATKSDAIALFKKSNDFSTLDALKKRGIEFGKRIFV